MSSFCPQCEREYPGETVNCPQCGFPLLTSFDYSVPAFTQSLCDSSPEFLTAGEDESALVIEKAAEDEAEGKPHLFHWLLSAICVILFLMALFHFLRTPVDQKEMQWLLYQRYRGGGTRMPGPGRQ